MGTNFYLKTESQRVIGEHYKERQDDVLAVLKKHNIALTSARKTEDFLQEILDALDITEVSVAYFTPEYGDHIGRESGMGLYCYDCDISVRTGMPGGLNVHDQPERDDYEKWTCPQCGKHVETHASLFAFAIDPKMVEDYPPDTRVINGYDAEMTMAEFRRQVIERAKFLSTRSIGEYFT